MTSRAVHESGSLPGTLAPGTVLDGRYEIEKVIGTGGMSVVYLALDRKFRLSERRCAVKEMQDRLTDAVTRQRAHEHFEREANLLVNLKGDPSVPEVYDYFNYNGRYYLVYEYIEGTDLARVLYEKARPLPPKEVLDWGIQLTRVLARLHALKPPIIFRDLKPSNVILRPDGEITLIDFGIAKHFQPIKGTMIGTAGYAPPEQYEGVANPRVDIYSLGATLHQLLTNTDPQEFPPFSFHKRAIRRYNPKVSEELNAVVARALLYEPEERWLDMQTLHRALKQLRESETGFFTSLHEEPPRPQPFDPSTNLGQRKEGRRGTRALLERLRQREEGGTRPVVQEPLPVGFPDAPGATAPVLADVGASARSESSVRPIWWFATEEEVRGTPAITEKAIYVGSYDSNLYCVGRANGEFRWKFPTEGGVTGRPALWRNLVFIGSEDGHIYALHHREGELVWRYPTQGAIRSSPCVDGDQVYIGSDDGSVYALHALNGQLIWQQSLGAPIRSSVAVADGRLFAGTMRGKIVGLETATGEQLWQTQATKGIISSPALSNKLMVIGSLDRSLYGLDQRSGWIVWRYRLDGGIYSSPLVVGERLYVATLKGTVYCLDVDWGTEIWKTPLGVQFASSPASAPNGNLYIGGNDGTLYGLTLDKGRLVWEHHTKSPLPGSPRVREGVLYIGSLDHHLYALPID